MTDAELIAVEERVEKTILRMFCLDVSQHRTKIDFGVLSDVLFELRDTQNKDSMRLIEISEIQDHEFNLRHYRQHWWQFWRPADGGKKKAKAKAKAKRKAKK